MQIELVQISLPRRNSINTEGKYTKKPRVMQTCLQLPRRNSVCGRQSEFRRSREQCKLVCNYRSAQVYVDEVQIPKKPRTMQTMIICTPLFQLTSKASIAMPRASCHSSISLGVSPFKGSNSLFTTQRILCFCGIRNYSCHFPS